MGAFTATGAAPQDLAGLSRYVDDELQRAAQASTSPWDGLRMQVLNVAPRKTAPGDIVFADGTNWNPGSGEGLYIRNAANTAWRYLG